VVGDGGLIYPERDPRALARAIMELKEDEERRRKLGALGRRQAEENFTWEKVALQMREVYRALSAPRSADAAILAAA